MSGAASGEGGSAGDGRATAVDADGPGEREHREGAGGRALIVATLGVVFGDIGTSPLYTIRETFAEAGAGGLVPAEDTVLGVLSLIFWSLIVVVSLKYVLLILWADNRGEGGVLALGTLAGRLVRGDKLGRRVVLTLSLFGLALFYGDGLITPAISVLSAVEGLETLNPDLEPFVVPIASAVLIGLFLIQSRGTAAVGRLFGPIMLVWFMVLGLLGLLSVLSSPDVLRALDPRHAAMLFWRHGHEAFLALGAVVLAITGAEALYADMGHFGRKPIRIAWYGLVLPCLTLNYFGQGALVLHERAALSHPFYHLAPSWALVPLILLATLATIIASQAVISGVFSLTRQAILLGHLPRMTIRHTSPTEIGQIYIPRINWMLMVGVLALVMVFQSSSGLASAYGISVTGAMAIDAILAGLVAMLLWRWGLWAALLFGALLVVDLAYVAANSLKIPTGGWFPLILALAVAGLIRIWRRGRAVLWRKVYGRAITVQSFLEHTDRRLIRVPGTAVFMTGNVALLPNALLHNIKHNKVLHQRVLLMTVRTIEEPHVPESDRVRVKDLGGNFWAVTARYGFQDEPDVPRALQLCQVGPAKVEMMATSFFLGREILIPSTRAELGPLAERLFILMSSTALPATAHFRIPPGQVVELGTQIEI